MKNFKKGFTLVEMLIVIAIVSILVMFIVVSIRESQIRSRDARRVAEINQIGKALQAYKSAMGKYPDAPGSNNANCTNLVAGNWEVGNGASDFLQALVTDNIVPAGGIPKEKTLPISNCTYAYTHVDLSCSDCQGSYGVLYARCEGKTCPAGEKICCKDNPNWPAPAGGDNLDSSDMVYFFKE